MANSLVQQIKSFIKEYTVDHWVGYDSSLPGERDFDTTYIPLSTMEDKPLGVFVAALYQWAKTDSLTAQKFEKAFKKAKRKDGDFYTFHPKDLLNLEDPVLVELVNKFYHTEPTQKMLSKIYKGLYTTEGVKKTAFEMAMLPFDEYGDEGKISDVVLEEGKLQERKGLLPSQVSRFNITNWIGDLVETNQLKAGQPHGLKVIVRNQYPKRSEIAFYYILEKVGGLLSLSGFTLTFASMITPLANMASVAGYIAAAAVSPMAGAAAFAMGFLTYQALGTPNLFKVFGLGDTLWRDGRWALSKSFLTMENFSFSQTAKSLLLLTSIVGLSALGAYPMIGWVASLPFMASVGSVATLAAGASAALFSFASSLTGLLAANYWFHGRPSFHDNQIKRVTTNERERVAAAFDAQNNLKARLAEVMDHENVGFVAPRRAQPSAILPAAVERLRREGDRRSPRLEQMMSEGSPRRPSSPTRH